MAVKAPRCVVEIDIHAVTSPGTRLISQNDVYLSICLFGQIQKTVKTSSLFPLLFYDELHFEKVFYTEYDPSHVSDVLERMMVHIDLMQVSSDGSDARLLAWFNCSALHFLYPIPDSFPRCGIHDREVLMERSVLFPGVSPKLEFSTRTFLKELHGRERLSRQRERKETRSASVSCACCCCASSSHSSDVVHHQSVPPRLNDILAAMSFHDCFMRRPPFVVRNVPDDLIGRQPRGDHLVSSKSGLFTNKSISSGCCCHCQDVEACVICQAFQRYLGRPYHRRCYSYCRHNSNRNLHSRVKDRSCSQGRKRNVSCTEGRTTFKQTGSGVTQVVNNTHNKEKKSCLSRSSGYRKSKKTAQDHKIIV